MIFTNEKSYKLYYQSHVICVLRYYLKVIKFIKIEGQPRSFCMTCIAYIIIYKLTLITLYVSHKLYSNYIFISI